MVSSPRRAPGGDPAVILVVGVNGTGKTTSIAKLGARFRRQDRRVLLAAADTFRAAAIEQLAEWARRLDVPGAELAQLERQQRQAAWEARCQIKPVMTDEEIANCKKVWKLPPPPPSP